LIISIRLLQSSLRLIDLANGLDCTINSSVELVLLLLILASNDYLTLNRHLQYYFDKTTVSLVQVPEIHQLLVFLEESDLFLVKSESIKSVNWRWCLTKSSSKVFLYFDLLLKGLILTC